ncbi:MAG: hypothetical protein QOG23_3631 [Blastocatellia bacterium]|jgi:hypothetical protein|nr:hypothetical protein [Blastocatellia bacterium]
MTALRDLSDFEQKLSRPIFRDGFLINASGLPEKISTLFEFGNGLCLIRSDKANTRSETILCREQAWDLICIDICVKVG